MRLVLDAGAFVAFDRGEVRVRGRIERARRHGFELITTSPVVAQVWRNGRTQALLARLLAATRIDKPDEMAARRAGELLAATKHSDAVDALVVGLAGRGDVILTSDLDDITALVEAARSGAAVIAI